MKNLGIVFCFVAIILVVITCQASHKYTVSNTELSIIPKPEKVELTVGKFTIKNNTVVYSNNKKLLPVADYMNAKINSALGFNLEKVEGSGKGINLLILDEKDESLGDEGYAAITCDYGNTRLVEGCGPAPETQEQRLAGIYDSIANGPRAVRAYRTSSIAMLAHSLLLGFPEVVKSKTAVPRISWGGFQTCIVSGIDNRFKAAAPVYGCAFHDEIIFKKYFDHITKEEEVLWMDKIHPKNYLPFSQCPKLFINGNKDGCFDIIPFDKTTKLIPEKNRYIRITPNMGHDHPNGWRPREIAAFFNSVLGNGIPLAKITTVPKKDTVIDFRYESSLSIRQARFYYSNDTVNINEMCIWQSIPAKIMEDKIVSPIPEEGFIFGFLYATDNMDISASSGILIN